ncbi:MAG: hypothetical protein LAO79_13325 [Acidobacteriia bacterium]|nr:hypothetical protein [Terriglobia bacterium]
MKKLALLLLSSVLLLRGDDGFAKWFQHFQSAVAKGNADFVTERAEFPMDWEYGSTRKIEARAVLVGKFDFYFTDEIKRAVANGKPQRLPSGDYMFTWKARGNEYSMYFKPSGGSFALFALSEGPP